MKDIFNLNELFIEHLNSIYNGEKRQLEFLTEAKKKVDSKPFLDIIEHHFKETQSQIKRLEQVFEMVDTKPSGEQNKGLEGVIQEGNELQERIGEPEVIDAALASIMQHINHYEMATYGTAASYAKLLGHHEAANLLHQTLEEEEKTDNELSKVAKESLNRRANKAVAK